MDWFKDKQNIILDCDGVILDSNTLKIKAFEEVAKRFLTGNKLTQYISYVKNNFGKSRKDMISHLISEYLKEKTIDPNNLIDDYAIAIKENYLKCLQTEGFTEFMAHFANIKDFYVVSGSDEKELKEVFQKRNIDYFFNSIQGSPTSKRDNLGNLLKTIDVVKTVYIGDSACDYEACKSNSLDFIFMSQYSTVSLDKRDLLLKNSKGHIKNLGDLI